MLSVNLEKGIVVNQTNNRVIRARKLPDFILEIIEDGGLIERLRKKRGS
jgi:3-isopropylmalate/(R)-2-methylmalate dehydratase small subunit